MDNKIILPYVSLTIAGIAIIAVGHGYLYEQPAITYAEILQIEMCKDESDAAVLACNIRENPPIDLSEFMEPEREINLQMPCRFNDPTLCSLIQNMPPPWEDKEYESERIEREEEQNACSDVWKQQFDNCMDRRFGIILKTDRIFMIP